MYHIIFLSPHSDPQAQFGEMDSGGQCVYEHQLAQALAGLPDVRVTTFCRQHYKRESITEVNNSYRIVRVECGPPRQIRKEEIAAVMPEFVSVVKNYLLKYYQTESLILHGHYWDGGLAALLLKQQWAHKLPLVWTPHSLGSLKQRKFVGSAEEWQYNFIPRACWEGYSIHVADKVVVSTDKEKQTVMSDYAGDVEKIVINPPGINSHDFTHDVDADTVTDGAAQRAARHQFGLPEDGTLLLGLGRLVRNKGYHRSIDVLAALAERTQQPIYLAIFSGAAEPATAEEAAYRTFLQQKVQDLQLEQRVFLKTAVQHEQVPIVFRAADVFLMSSEHEPFGLVTVEAMAAGLPVIAHNSGGSLDIIRHNINGILVDYSKPKRVAAYIYSLLKDESLCTELAVAAQRTARKEYDWYQKSQAMNQIYRQISRIEPVNQFQTLVAENYFLRQNLVYAASQRQLSNAQKPERVR